MTVPTTCSIDGCDRPRPYVKGMCNAHYLKQRKYGDPLFVAKPPPPEGCKVCCQCREALPVEDFNRLSAAKDGMYPACRKCANSRKRAQYASDPESVLARNYASRIRHAERRQASWKAAWAASDPEEKRDAFRRRHLLRTFGLTVEQYQEMHDRQGGVCAVCELPETDVEPRTNRVRYLAVDHCHTTGRVRGLLCRRCNVALGLLDDSVEKLRKLQSYLE